jgi:hypothetical protein
MPKALVVAVLAMVLGTGCAKAASQPRSAPAGSASPTGEVRSCEEVVPDCHADRLPDLVLTGDQTSGALDSVDGFSMDGIISFDQALTRAWEEDGQGAKTVQVVLGSADAPNLHWGDKPGLYYAIEWDGVCGLLMSGLGPGPSPTSSPSPSPSPPPSPSCDGDWGTVIDAHTGAFVVGGT